MRVLSPWHFVLITFCALLLKVTAWEEKRCFSIDLRNSPKLGYKPLAVKDGWEVYIECTILDGDVTISMMTGENITDDQFPVFPHLREITGSILVYNVKGLTNLGHIFPNLRIIGGHSLIMNYALVIYQNEDLKYIGFDKLTVIRNGGVRVMENKKLCYTRYINWDSILIGKIRDVMIDQGSGITFAEDNGDIPSCKDHMGCKEKEGTKCQRVDGVLSCWNATTCQPYCKYHKINNSTIGPGCTPPGDKCHSSCLGGCENRNDPSTCYACRNYELNGVCVERCPPNTYEYMDNRCVTEAECHRKLPVKSSITLDKVLWKAFQGKCHYDCPDGYREDPNNPRNCILCLSFCPRVCRGEQIDSIGEAMKLAKCNIIDGNLDINIQIGGQTTNAEKFTEAFGNIREIKGHLSVRFCPTFTSLHMFKNLQIIHGNDLANDRYALTVFEMESLRQLFSPEVEKTIKIKKGLISFQNNPQLCPKKIMRFVSQVELENNVTDNDISKYSNGDKAICEEVPLDVKVIGTYFFGFSLFWKKFNTTDMDQRKFFGYLIYFKKVDAIDYKMDIDDNRAACGDSWQMKFVAETDREEEKENQTELVENLEPNSIYAFYVQTKTVHHPGARNAISKIGFAKTTFSPPDMPRLKRYESRGHDKIILEWDPPIKTNGIITHYNVAWYAKTDNSDNLVGCGTNPTHAVASIAKKANKEEEEDTCPATKGCCKCADVKDIPLDTIDQPEIEVSVEQEAEKAKFENAVQNLVFVQHCSVVYDPWHCGPEYAPKEVKEQIKRVRRRLKPRHHHSHRAISHSSFEQSHNKPLIINPNASSKEAETENTSKARTIRSILGAKEPVKESEKDQEIPDGDILAIPKVVHENVTSGKINVTSTRIVITNLKHYTEYNIQIAACQDENAPENFCSKQVASKFIRTGSIPEKDMVDKDTVEVSRFIDEKGVDQENSRFLTWQLPDDPNGIILGFRYKYWRPDTDSSLTEHCINITEFNEINGIKAERLPNGVYSLQIRTETIAGFSEPMIIEDFFEIYVPGWLTWQRAIYILLGLIFIITVSVAIGYRYVRRHFGKKVQEYIRQTISANPEYITQLDVYKTDEWELKREDLKLFDEIGRGTFGKVYLGEGNNITSVCGINFGKCAIKTIPECASNAERLHFLIEASVMKQFNTAYIVKLYGVVSEGQSVLVVMEMMDQGNLRDYLRARRPDAEENTGNNPLPTMISYFKWAAQISDGMAYLESLKFCHRDLAARNCMVANDETVKIGDFGMARDIYYHEYYKPAGKRLMPVRWMAPESLKDGKFTVKSDVWSYGIVIYEMLTLGQQPYAGLGNDQVYNYIGVRRNILIRPQGCPDFWYDLMRVCWKYDPRDRPSFYQILLYLRHTIDSGFKEHMDLRQEGLSVFEKSFVMSNINEIEDEEDYDFTYNEDEENARKHTMLQELDRMQAAQDDYNSEYYKSGFGAPTNVNSNSEETENLMGEGENGEKFSMFALQDLPMAGVMPENPRLLTKKELKARDEKREKINKRQVELEKEWQKKKDDEKQYVEAIEMKEKDQKAPLLMSTGKPEPPSPQLSPVAAHVHENDNYKTLAPTANNSSRGSKHRPPNAATTDMEKEKNDYTEIFPLTKNDT